MFIILIIISMISSSSKVADTNIDSSHSESDPTEDGNLPEEPESPRIVILTLDPQVTMNLIPYLKPVKYWTLNY
jgi:hypothetical protein